MSRRKKRHNKKTDQQPKPKLFHSADRRCIVGQPVTPKKTYRPTAR